MHSFSLGAIIIAVLSVIASASRECGQINYASLPAAAVGPSISNATGYHIKPLGQGAHMVTDGVYQALFLVSNEGVVVVDAPPALVTSLIGAIKTITHLDITHFIYSHAHADHVGAAYLLIDSGNVTTIAHELTAKEPARVGGDPNRPAPSIAFETSYRLQVGNQSLELAYNGPNHEPGNTFIYAPGQKILMLVDVAFPGWVPFDRLGKARDVPGFIRAHSQILDYDFDFYIGGHLGRIGTRQDVLIQQEHVHDLFVNCKHAIELSAQPPSANNVILAPSFLLPEERINPGNSWAYLKTYLDTVAAYCANLTIEKWLGRLGGADVYGFNNAAAMIDSIRIDYGVLEPFPAR